MVELVVRDFDNPTVLETKLVEADIEYQLKFYMGEYGLKPPHLIVGGVPLDYERSLKWIKEHSANE